MSNKELINVNELMDIVYEENLKIIDCRFDLKNKTYGRDKFLEGHIPGAIFLNIEEELSGPVEVHGGRHPLPKVEHIHKILQQKGISIEDKIVIYDDGDFSGAGRARLILKYLGFKNIYILDGGFDFYKNAIGVISMNNGDYTNSSFDIKLDNSIFVDMEYVKKSLGDERIAIIDSREPDRYRGIVEPVDIKKGHIPGALNYFWLDVIDKNTKLMKSKDELEQHFKNLRDFDEVIIYCGSGITASVNSLAMDIIGLEHKVYAGSFSDWISYNDNKIDSNI